MEQLPQSVLTVLGKGLEAGLDDLRKTMGLVEQGDEVYLPFLSDEIQRLKTVILFYEEQLQCDPYTSYFGKIFRRFVDTAIQHPKMGEVLSGHPLETAAPAISNTD
jgi:hypothetical protein